MIANFYDQFNIVIPKALEIVRFCYEFVKDYISLLIITFISIAFFRFYIISSRIISEKDGIISEKDVIISDKDGIISDKDKKIYKGSVQSYFDNGLPCLEKQKGFSTANSSTNHKLDVNIICTEKKLMILSNIEEYRESSFDFQSSIFSKVKDGYLKYVSESDVQGFVKDIIYDVLQASKLFKKCECFNEITLVKFRPDIWVIMTKNMLPLCVIEVKKPNEKFELVTNKEFIIQVLLQMIVLKLYH